MARPVLLVVMMANMLLGKNVLLHTNNKAYIIGLEHNGRTTPEHGKDYKDYWGVNINVNFGTTRAPTWAPTRAPTWAPTRAPTRPVCSTQRRSREKKIMGLNQGWIDFSCMSGGSDRRHRMKRQVMPMACLTIEVVLAGCEYHRTNGIHRSSGALKKVSLNMNGV